MTNLVLWLLARLRPLIRIAGADYGQLRAIVQVKLMMDSRRNTVNLGRYGKKANEESNSAFLKTLAIYAVLGSLLSIGMLGVPEPDVIFFPLTLQFAYIMALCALTLISDFSTVILDSSDNQIILPRPVDSRTLWLARIVHISSYLTAIALAISLGGLLVVSYRFGALAGLMFLIVALLSAVLMVFLTNVFYLGLMRFISEDKLREVINYVQIVMAILFYGGYQLLPRLMDTNELFSRALPHEWWHFLVPPMWMAGAVDLIVKPALDSTHLTFLFLALTMPILGLWAMNRFLTAGFVQKLSGLDQETQPAVRKDISGAKPMAEQRSGGIIEQLSGWLTSNPLERAAFGFAWRVTGRDRKFKLKTYPQLGFALAYTVGMSFQKTEGMFYLFALYFSGIYAMVAQLQLSVSDNYRASWVYGSAPIRQPGDVLVGSLKALITKLLLPFYILIATYILYQFGTDKIDDVLLAFSNSLVMLMSSALLSKRYMPFSIAQDALSQNNTSRGIMIAAILGVVGLAHFGLTFLPYGVWIALPFSIALFAYLLAAYRKTGWESVEFQ